MHKSSIISEEFRGRHIHSDAPEAAWGGLKGQGDILLFVSFACPVRCFARSATEEANGVPGTPCPPEARKR